MNDELEGLRAKNIELASRVAELEKLVDDLGVNPGPEDNETQEEALKRTHAKAWEWCMVADQACRELSRITKAIAARANEGSKTAKKLLSILSSQL